jgi:predicted glycosyltransferase
VFFIDAVVQIISASVIGIIVMSGKPREEKLLRDKRAELMSTFSVFSFSTTFKK